VALMRVSAAQAGVWGVDPSVGISGDYSTNPDLFIDPPPHTAQTHGAVLLNAPTVYNGDATSLSIVPSFRLSDSSGYSSLASDYEHLSLKGEIDTERSTLTAAATLNQDSSLYQDYLSDGNTGVKRDTVAADVNWQRFMTERLSAGAEVNWTQVKYAQVAGVGTLTNFRDLTISPSLIWNSSERNKITFVLSGSRYTSLDGTTESRSANAQVGFVHQFSPIWSLEADAGYSRALNRITFDEEVLVFLPTGQPAIELVPLNVKSSQNGTIYSVILSRKAEMLTLNLSASRQLVPSGFAYLSQQTAAALSVNYTLSERWSLSADARYLRAQDPQLQGGVSVRTPWSLSGGASWRWSEHLTASLNASRVVERFNPPGATPSSNEVAITFTYLFNHIKFQ
jgi:hypothetical protein